MSFVMFNSGRNQCLVQWHGSYTIKTINLQYSKKQKQIS